MKLIVVCEAQADFLLAETFVRRLLASSNQTNVVRLDFHGWSGSERREFARWTELDRHLDGRERRRLMGRSDGNFRKSAEKALFLAAKEPGSLVALILMADLDDEPQRRASLIEARTRATGLSCEVLVATPDPMREAWVLHGFLPRGIREEKEHARVKRELGFDPCLESHRLRGKASRGTAERDPKVVVDRLCSDDFERQAICWQETPLSDLEARGRETFLTHFLEEIRERVIPALAGP
jgi:hypothetical protein